MTRPRHAFGQQPGRLAATMLRALAAELSEPGRYARGKAYARDGAVIDIDIREGSIGGLVLGSRPDPYEARLVVDPAGVREVLAHRLFLGVWQRRPEALQRVDASCFERLFVAPDQLADSFFERLRAVRGSARRRRRCPHRRWDWW